VLIAHILIPGALYGLGMFQLLNLKQFFCCEAGNQFSCGCALVTSIYMKVLMQGFTKPFLGAVWKMDEVHMWHLNVHVDDGYHARSGSFIAP
jgi:hypothetical protein